MTSTRRSFVFGALFGAFLTLSSGAQALAQGQPARPVSPRRSVELPLPGSKKVSIDYGSPEARGRKVMGTLVPFDQVWRLGANKATHLTTDVDLVIGGKEVPAGTYSLFATPMKDKWVLEINKATGMWGIPYKPEYEKTVLAKVDMKVENMPAAQDRFLITLARNGTENWLICEWENTRAMVSFSDKK